MIDYYVKITPQAKIQLSKILNYIQNTLQAPIAAENLLNEIEKSILSLSNMPKRIALTEEEPWRSHGIHKMSVKNYLIYFRVDDSVREVHIIAIIYGRREQNEQLREIKL